MTRRWPDRERIITGEIDRLCDMVAFGCRLNETPLSTHVYSVARGLKNNLRPEKRFTSESRIALVIPYHPLDETGGLEIGTRMIAQGLHQLGHLVEIISRGHYLHRDWSGEHQTPEGITVRGIGTGIEGINQFLFQHLSRYDVIQWMEIFPPVPEDPEQFNDKAEQQYLASVLLRAKGKRTYLYTATSGNVEKRGTNNPDWIEMRKHQSFNALIPVAFTGVNYANPEIKNEYVDAGIEISSSRQQFIPFGVDTMTFKPVVDGAEQKALRRKLGLPLDKMIFIYLGRFVQRKRADFLLDVWSQLPDDIHQKAVLVFAGGSAGEGQPDSIYEEMMRILPGVRSTKVLDYVPHEQVASLLKACDVMISPTIREGWPLALLEAMSCGIPVISSRIDGVKIIVQDGINGTLITPDSGEELSKAIVDATQSPKHYQKMSLTARASVESTYGWDKISLIYRQFYCREF